MKPADIFGKELKVINIGLQSFKDSLDAAGAAAVQVDWRPPAGGDATMIDALKKLNRAKSALDE